jgi:hypothetical protein
MKVVYIDVSKFKKFDKIESVQFFYEKNLKNSNENIVKTYKFIEPVQIFNYFKT